MDDKQKADILAAHDSAARKLKAAGHDPEKLQTIKVSDYLVLVEAATAGAPRPTPPGGSGGK